MVGWITFVAVSTSVALLLAWRLARPWVDARTREQRVRDRVAAGEHSVMARAAEDGPRLFAEARERERVRMKWRESRCCFAGQGGVCVLDVGHAGSHVFGSVE